MTTTTSAAAPQKCGGQKTAAAVPAAQGVNLAAVAAAEPGRKNAFLRRLRKTQNPLPTWQPRRDDGGDACGNGGGGGDLEELHRLKEELRRNNDYVGAAGIRQMVTKLMADRKLGEEQRRERDGAGDGRAGNPWALGEQGAVTSEGDGRGKPRRGALAGMLGLFSLKSEAVASSAGACASKPSTLHRASPPSAAEEPVYIMRRGTILDVSQDLAGIIGDVAEAEEDGDALAHVTDEDSLFRFRIGAVGGLGGRFQWRRRSSTGERAGSLHRRRNSTGSVHSLAGDGAEECHSSSDLLGVASVRDSNTEATAEVHPASALRTRRGAIGFRRISIVAAVRPARRNSTGSLHGSATDLEYVDVDIVTYDGPGEIAGVRSSGDDCLGLDRIAPSSGSAAGRLRRGAMGFRRASTAATARSGRRFSTGSFRGSATDLEFVDVDIYTYDGPGEIARVQSSGDDGRLGPDRNAPSPGSAAAGRPRRGAMGFRRASAAAAARPSLVRRNTIGSLREFAHELADRCAACDERDVACGSDIICGFGSSGEERFDSSSRTLKSQWTDEIKELKVVPVRRNYSGAFASPWPEETIARPRMAAPSS